LAPPVARERRMIRLEDHVREVPDFPKKGILFKDIMPMLRSPEAFRTAIEALAARVERPDAVVGIESRGFLFGAPLALHWRVPFVPARKFGKLPGRTVRQGDSLEDGGGPPRLDAGPPAPGPRGRVGGGPARPCGAPAPAPAR